MSPVICRQSEMQTSLGVLGAIYEERANGQPDSAIDRHIFRRRVPSHKAQANSSERPAQSQGYRNVYSDMPTRWRH
ncbi:hypothetical protein CFAM422_007311 [Trichoderma lentiforme]|uniref:Uncharacterized protein n=1 Tax=Trichoderma lentiforme TaxID=1567552 RepID=A0A9P4XEA0_9HYPO|nr:hypothetical protein CFAM422_007311 [Trichoderma lentiforme]